MEMMNYQVGRSSYQDSLKVLEADIQYANTLAAAIPREKSGARLQMKLTYNGLAPVFLFLLRWIDSSCTCLLPGYMNFFHVLVYKVRTDGRPRISRHGRRATINDFYGVILPSLQQLHSNLVELDDCKVVNHGIGSSQEKVKGDSKFSNFEAEREDECGICLEPCNKMVLPNCCHAMCINCYRDWNTRSESCPFCRGNLKRVKSRDLWVLTCNDEVVDPETVSKEDLLHFYLYSSEEILMIENSKISVTFMTLLQPIAVDDNWVDSQFGVASSSVFFSVKRCYGILQKLVQLLKQLALEDDDMEDKSTTKVA